MGFGTSSNGRTREFGSRYYGSSPYVPAMLNMKKDIAVIILAAGKSTRMKSELPKVLHPICGRPMLNYVLELASSLKPKHVVAVLGYKQGLVRKIIPRGTKIVIQKKLIGKIGRAHV